MNKKERIKKQLDEFQEGKIQWPASLQMGTYYRHLGFGNYKKIIYIGHHCYNFNIKDERKLMGLKPTPESLPLYKASNALIIQALEIFKNKRIENINHKNREMAELLESSTDEDYINHKLEGFNSADNYYNWAISQLCRQLKDNGQEELGQLAGLLL